MARDFTKNTSNYCAIGVNQFGPILNGASVISVAMWVQADTLTGTANNNRMFSIYNRDGNTALSFLTDASNHLRVGGRSADEGFQFKDTTTTIATDGSWTRLGGVFNFAAGTITPYINGGAEGGGGVTFSNTTWINNVPTTTNDIVGGDAASGGGGPTATGQQFDGRIAEWAIWRIDIGATAFANLALGYLPSVVHATQPVFWMRLLGDTSPEPSVISSVQGTITGSVPQATHPPIIYPPKGYPRSTARGVGRGLGLRLIA